MLAERNKKNQKKGYWINVGMVWHMRNTWFIRWKKKSWDDFLRFSLPQVLLFFFITESFNGPHNVSLPQKFLWQKHKSQEKYNQKIKSLSDFLVYLERFE